MRVADEQWDNKCGTMGVNGGSTLGELDGRLVICGRVDLKNPRQLSMPSLGSGDLLRARKLPLS